MSLLPSLLSFSINRAAPSTSPSPFQENQLFFKFRKKRTEIIQKAEDALVTC